MSYGDPIPYSAEDIKKMNEENDARQRQLNADYEKERASWPLVEQKVYYRKISCLTCGVVMQWTWTKGDRAQVADLQALYIRLSKHQNIPKGHILRFHQKIYSIQVPQPPSPSVPPSDPHR